MCKDSYICTLVVIFYYCCSGQLHWARTGIFLLAELSPSEGHGATVESIVLLSFSVLLWCLFTYGCASWCPATSPYSVLCWESSRAYSYNHFTAYNLTFLSQASNLTTLTQRMCDRCNILGFSCRSAHTIKVQFFKIVCGRSNCKLTPQFS